MQELSVAVKMPERTPPKMMAMSSRPGMATDAAAAPTVREAGERLGRIAALARDDIGGDHQRQRPAAGPG